MNSALPDKLLQPTEATLPQTMNRPSISLRLLGIAALASLCLTGCGIGAGSALRPVTSGPKRVRLGGAVVVDTGIADGRVYLPSGVYSAVGENEKGVYYAAPGGVGINWVMTAVSPSVVSTGNVGMMLPGGVCVHPTTPDASSVTSYATWRAAVWAPEKPKLLTPATPPVTLSAVR